MKNSETRRRFLPGKMGIKGKILAYLALFVAFILSLIWICQIALLFDFYRSHRTSQITNTAEALIANASNEDLESLADKLSASNDLCILLLDENGHRIVSGDHVRFCTIHHMNPRDISKLVADAPEDGSSLLKSMTVIPFENERYKKNRFIGPVPEEAAATGRSLIYVQKIDIGEGKQGTLILDAVITPLQSTIATLKNQFSFIVVAILVATVVIGALIARSISRPIIETNKAAKELGRYRYERPEHGDGYREIAELNETLIRAAVDLNKVDKLQRELMANISHDLRTPLTMIGGYAEVMRDIPDENTPENMQIIIDETNRLTSLVNEVMEFSQIQAGNKPIEKTEYDITEQIGNICTRVSKMTGADGYHTVFDHEDHVRVLADEQAVGQVVYNLLGNALTYTGSDKTVRVCQLLKEKTVRVEIRDSGKGIDPEDLPYIWDRYYRSKENHRRAVIGSGLGLSIVRGILEKHQAAYGVSSGEENGTVFWFELPVVKNEPTEKVKKLSLNS